VELSSFTKESSKLLLILSSIILSINLRSKEKKRPFITTSHSLTVKITSTLNRLNTALKLSIEPLILRTFKF